MEQLRQNTSYKIGKFVILMDRDELKVIVHENKLNLNIRPKSDNSIIIKAEK